MGSSQVLVQASASINNT